MERATGGDGDCRAPDFVPAGDAPDGVEDVAERGAGVDGIVDHEHPPCPFYHADDFSRELNGAFLPLPGLHGQHPGLGDSESVRHPAGRLPEQAEQKSGALLVGCRRAPEFHRGVGRVGEKACGDVFAAGEYAEDEVRDVASADFLPEGRACRVEAFFV